jgi:3-hydroxyisobutyrate dehydrogenase
MHATHDTRIGWIGTGVMGGSMCGHLLAAGFPVGVYTRTPAKAEALRARGAVWRATPRAVAERADAVFTMVGYPADVEAVMFGDEGILAAARPGLLVVDMTTSEPALAERIFHAAAARGARALDAPVSGGDVGARDATLAIMVGGEAAALEAARPLLQCLGKTISHMGPAGAGQHTKMSNQILCAGNMVGVVESLLYAARANLDLSRVIDVLGSGAAQSWAINNLGRRIVRGDYAPGFFIKHFVKDMGIALAEAERMRLALPGLALAHRFYAQAVEMNLGERGTQALYQVLERLNPPGARG